MTPLAYAEKLSPIYPRHLTSLVYTETVALLARAKLGQAQEVSRLLEPWTSGSKNSLENATPSHYSGHLVFTELPEGKPFLERAADLALREPKDNEMSDSIFMVCPLLASVEKVSEALAHFKKMEKIGLREDGLYRHSPSSPTAWGRGNGFPILGLALTLEKTPAHHNAFAELKSAFSKLSASLGRFQDSGGMWRQVIDEPSAPTEFSSTAMIGTAYALGIQKGWLDPDLYKPRLAKAWDAVAAHTLPGGEVLDVCESTGRMDSKEAYLNRKLIRGFDDRGGSLALLFAATYEKRNGQS